MQKTPYDNFEGLFFQTGGITTQFILPIPVKLNSEI